MIPRNRIRRLAIAAAALLALLGIASFVLWRWVEGRMQQGFADWQQAAAAQGWTVRTGAITRGGWPFAAALTFSDVALTGDAASSPGGLAYTAARLTLRLDLRDPTAATLRADGAQSLRLGPSPALPFTADHFVLTIPLRPRPTEAELNAGTLRFGAPWDGASIGLLEANADWSAPKTTAIRLSAEAITLPDSAQAALGPHIASATFAGSYAGTIPAQAATAKAAAAGWRDSGGALILQRIALGWGPLGVSGTASFKLDAALQPEATATLRLIGLDDTLTAFAAANIVTRRTAQTAKAVIGLMAHAPEGGGAPGVEAPLTLHDGVVSLGMIPLANFGKLNWPDAP